MRRRRGESFIWKSGGGACCCLLLGVQAGRRELGGQGREYFSRPSPIDDAEGERPHRSRGTPSRYFYHFLQIQSWFGKFFSCFEQTCLFESLKSHCFGSWNVHCNLTSFLKNRRPYSLFCKSTNQIVVMNIAKQDGVESKYTLEENLPLFFQITNKCCRDQLRSTTRNCSSLHFPVVRLWSGKLIRQALLHRAKTNGRRKKRNNLK